LPAVALAFSMWSKVLFVMWLPEESVSRIAPNPVCPGANWSPMSPTGVMERILPRNGARMYRLEIIYNVTALTTLDPPGPLWILRAGPGQIRFHGRHGREPVQLFCRPPMWLASGDFGVANATRRVPFLLRTSN
jgi:hypothetical protein